MYKNNPIIKYKTIKFKSITQDLVAKEKPNSEFHERKYLNSIKEILQFLIIVILYIHTYPVLLIIYNIYNNNIIIYTHIPGPVRFKQPVLSLKPQTKLY